jgi:hypothetical protein
MFPNATLMKPQTWNNILELMIRVRDRFAETSVPGRNLPTVQIGTF